MQIRHKLLERWKSLHRNEKIALLTFLGTSIVGVLASLLGNQSDTINLSTNGGTAANVHAGTNDIRANVIKNNEFNTGGIRANVTKNFEVNLKGKIDAELVKKLGVTEAAIHNLFKILKRKKVSPEELDHELRKLAERHKELEKLASLQESGDPEVQALQQEARKAITKGEYEKAEDLLGKAVELDDAAAEKLGEIYLKRKLSAAGNQFLKAQALYARFELNKAIKAYKKAIQYAQDGKHPARVSRYQNQLGIAYSAKSEFLKSIEYFELALNNYLRNIKMNYKNPNMVSTVALYRLNISDAYFKLGESKKAIELSTEIINDVGSFKPLIVTAAANLILGASYLQLEKNDEAIKHLKYAQNISNRYRQNVTSFLEYERSEYSIQSDIEFNLGLAYAEIGNYKKAVCNYEQALKIRLKVYGEDHPFVAIVRNNLGNAWHQLDEYHEAIEYFEQALASFEKYLGKDHLFTQITQDNLDAARTVLSQFRLN